MTFEEMTMSVEVTVERPDRDVMKEEKVENSVFVTEEGLPPPACA
jgi:hypothetical protein